MTTVAVIDHGAGNLVSIGNGLRRSGASVEIVTGPDGLAGVDGIVLPGVGSAAAAMARIDDAGLSPALRRWSGPLLGICVGFQLLFERSEEGEAECLGLLPGRVRRLEGRPLPHMGWNDVALTEADPLFAGIPDGELFYFVHSYAPVVAPGAAEIASVGYCGQRITVAARAGAVTGVQFHPERSAAAGHRILTNFVVACGETARAA